MEFRQFNELMQQHIEETFRDHEYLFSVHLNKETVWDTYLNSFPPGTNEIFRERSDHDCSCCRHYIRDLGRVVALNNGKMTTIWDFETGSDKYQPVVDALSTLIKSAPIIEVFIPTTTRIGTVKNVELTTDGGTYTWRHFYTVLPGFLRKFKLCDFGTVQGRMRDNRNVLQRSLEELDPESIDTVLELIAQKSLYKGEEWQSPLKTFKKLQKEYGKTSGEERDNFSWEQSVRVGPVVAKIKNHSIGVLLTDLSEGMELDEAVRRYEKIVAPTNYKRPRAIFTKKMVEQAKKTVEELRLSDSLGRRYAQLEDITVNNTLFANRNAARAMAGDAFDELAAGVPARPRNLSKVEEVDVDTFVRDILPKVSEMEVLLENKHAGNMVSLIAPQNPDSKPLFKWGNGFSWAYSGNITDSMKERVKAAGGKVDGVLRFSIQWNDQGDSDDDLDAHCLEPGGNLIYFNAMVSGHTGGELDVDVVDPQRDTKDGVAVENITWASKGRMTPGTYKFLVHCYSSRRAKSGFSAEVEFEGNIFSFEYTSPLRQSQKVPVAEVKFDGENFQIKEMLESRHASREVWGIQSNQFHPVTIATYSPNCWDEQKGIGHRHYFFMLDQCMNPESPNGFFNEFLHEKLMEHKRVFEALGSKMRVEDVDTQLSGLGFSATKRASLVCKLKGNFERMLKVKF